MERPQAEIRTLDILVDDKLEINDFNHNHLRWCACWVSGIAKETHLPIHYKHEDKERYKRCFTPTHGSCKICACIVYQENFGMTYEEAHKELSTIYKARI